MSEEEKKEEKGFNVQKELADIQKAIEDARTELLKAIEDGYATIKKILTSENW